MASVAPNPAKRLTGTCKCWKMDKGYGFIQGSDGQDYFVLQTEIKSAGFRSLAVGEQLEFERKESGRGGRPLAGNVTGPGGTNVQGDPRAAPGACFKFLRGSCTHGESCLYLHIGGGATQANLTTPDPTTQALQYIYNPAAYVQQTAAAQTAYAQPQMAYATAQGGLVYAQPQYAAQNLVYASAAGQQQVVAAPTYMVNPAAATTVQPQLDLLQKYTQAATAAVATDPNAAQPQTTSHQAVSYAQPLQQQTVPTGQQPAYASVGYSKADYSRPSEGAQSVRYNPLG